jgi:hypothetical protein
MIVYKGIYFQGLSQPATIRMAHPTGSLYRVWKGTGFGNLTVNFGRHDLFACLNEMFARIKLEI